MSSPARQKRLSQAERIAISDNNMLQAASELILEVGSANTTLKDVGERAGYSRGLASARFGSKEELFLRLISSHRQIWSDEIDRHIGNKTGFAAPMGNVHTRPAVVVAWRISGCNEECIGAGNPLLIPVIQSVRP